MRDHFFLAEDLDGFAYTNVDLMLILRVEDWRELNCFTKQNESKVSRRCSRREGEGIEADRRVSCLFLTIAM